MSEAYLGEIRMFAGNYAPAGWMLCHGTIISINDNEALYTLFGTSYGGDGISNFRLPDLRGRVPIHKGQGPGLSHREHGQNLGVEQVTLTTASMPAHGHRIATSSQQSTDTPGPTVTWGPGGSYGSPSPQTNMGSTSPSGNSQAHENIQPSLAVNFIICVAGIYPTWS